jgi:hypothetical protein
MSKTYSPCEPFQAYNRLEGRPRKEELDDALAARVHDPLWMLARQYQFGEFKGEDAGSAIDAKIALHTTRMRQFQAPEQAVEPLDNKVPLETVVERLPMQMDVKTAHRCGNHFLHLLDEAAADNPPSEPYQNGQYREALSLRFPFALPELNQNEGAATTLSKARTLSLQSASAYTRALVGRAVNAAALYDFLAGNALAINQLVVPANTAANTSKFVHSGHQSILQSAATQWLLWIKSELNLPAHNNNPCWQDEKLEYTFNTRVDEGNNGFTELHAEEYAHGHLDWYSFDVKTANTSVQKTFDPNLRKGWSFSFIPTEASFAGAPHNRWWQMEDGSVDLANLKATETDLAKIVVSQYALQYSTDWLVVPFDLPTGSFTAIDGIVVTDTFGQHTLVESAHSKDAEEWNSFNLYSISYAGDEFDAPNFDKRLLLPPAVARVHESEPLEQVKFIRDEMANLVWGIEKRVPNGLGGGIAGDEAANNLEAVLREMEPDQEAPDDFTLPTSTPAGATPEVAQYKAPLKYQLGNSVAENWIPFVAAHLPGSNREIHFQRASMPRITSLFPPHAVRPRTPLLRKNITQQDAQQAPFYLNEEEIPRAGAIVKGTYQRTRWHSGRIVTWFGRRKQTGRGEGSSGLRFDLVVDNK